MDRKFVALVAAALSTLVGVGSARAEVRTLCGVRQGSFGNAWLGGAKGRVVLELARQGGDQRLLDQADAALPARRGAEAGTQVGRRYCLVVRSGVRGRPARILAARRS